MYELGNQFKFSFEDAIANPECVVRGNKFRITVLTERLVRLEYSKTGNFVDSPSSLVLFRNFPKPEFAINQNNSDIEIVTNYFKLTYKKEKPFYGGIVQPSSNLRIELLNVEKKVWYYKHPEVRNYGANVSNTNTQKGLYSIDGFVSIDDSKNPIFKENGGFTTRSDDSIDIYVFMYNTDFYLCLSDYFKLTGYPPLIPRYALGTWWNKKDTYKEAEIARFIKTAEINGVPISMFTLYNWSNNAYGFDVSYKDPYSVSQYLHTKKIIFGLTIQDPVYIKRDMGLYSNLNNYLVKDKSGNIPFNLYNERVIDAFLKILIHPLNNIGIDFYSLDSYDKDNLDRLFLLKHYLFCDKNNGERSIIVGKNSKLAAHRYPILYAGEVNVDWKSLKEIPMFNSSASNIGVSFWSHDCGGTYGGIEDSELFIRYIQLLTFSPILRLGSEAGKFYKREPWKWGLKPAKIATDFINQRYKMIPYLYTESYKYHKYGKPLIEPIYYKNPEMYDDDLYKHSYYFGSEMFVSPIISKKDYVMNRVIHKLYIPEGTWYDYYSGKKYIGNKKYVSFYKDEEYPVFVKAGAIIPLSLNKYNDTSVPTNMEIDVFPGNSNSYSIYEDDGVTDGYKEGKYLISNIEFLYKKNNYSLTILPVKGVTGIAPKTRNYKIKFNNTKIVAKVLTYSGSDRIHNYSYSDDKTLIVEVNDVPTDKQLTVLCSGDNIEYDSIKIINDDIESIISDLPIKTVVKDRIDKIMFNPNLELKKKRIEIRKLGHGKDYLESKYIDLFLKLLEYIGEM